MTASTADARLRVSPARVPAVLPRVSHRTHRARTVWNAGAVLVIWGTSLFVAALWVAGGGLEDLTSGTGDALTTLGRLTGLVSANLLLYQVLLMAQIPLFERGFGRDGMTRLHRFVGFWSLWLMLAHIVLVTAAYALTAHVNVIAQLVDFVLNYPAMLLATAGTILIIAVAITSVRRARRRLRYESWHLLHLYGYLGVGLALPHQLWTGADFLSSPAATTYWWGLWAVTAAAVVLFRITLPLLRSARAGLRVESVVPDGSDAVRVVMRARPGRAPRAAAGQFFTWRFVDGPGWTRGHPLSLAAAPTGGRLEVAVRVVGDGTARVRELRPGTRVLVEGPFGHLTAAARTRRRLVAFACGSGISPIVSLLEGETDADAVLVTRDHDASTAMLSDRISALRRDRGLTHYRLDGPRSRGEATWLPQTHAAWRGGELASWFVGNPDECDVFVVGPDAWTAALVTDLRTAGIPAARIHTESFSI